MLAGISLDPAPSLASAPSGRTARRRSSRMIAVLDRAAAAHKIANPSSLSRFSVATMTPGLATVPNRTCGNWTMQQACENRNNLVGWPVGSVKRASMDRKLWHVREACVSTSKSMWSYAVLVNPSPVVTWVAVLANGLESSERCMRTMGCA